MLARVCQRARECPRPDFLALAKTELGGGRRPQPAPSRDDQCCPNRSEILSKTLLRRSITAKWNNLASPSLSSHDFQNVAAQPIPDRSKQKLAPRVWSSPQAVQVLGSGSRSSALTVSSSSLSIIARRDIETDFLYLGRPKDPKLIEPDRQVVGPSGLYRCRATFRSPNRGVCCGRDMQTYAFFRIALIVARTNGTTTES